MSLILEALKRSEQERHRERAPDLRTVHQPVVAPPARSVPWRALLIGLVVFNLNGVAVWWLLQERGGQELLNDEFASAQPVVRSAAPAAEAPAPATAETMGRVEQEQPVAAVAPSATETPSPARVDTQPPAADPAVAAAPPADLPRPPARSLAELEPELRAALPAMTFSFHVFSANPERRSIIINERRMGEGTEVAPGWWLEEITAQGVVLAGAGERVYIPVLSHW